MDFLDNVVKSSNALIKERLNNPFGNKQPGKQSDSGSSESPLAPQGSQAATDAEPDISSDRAEHIASSSSDGPSSDANRDDKNSQFAAIAADADAVAQKAVKGAKNIGTFLFSMANKAGHTVTQTAKQVKQAVESTSILTDFTREQQEFLKEHGGSMQAGELPWANYDDEAKAAEIKEQILSLSQDKRNFVRSPPNDSSFQFDAQQCYPIALSLLKEDPNLNKMRFELVPKFVNEDTFWCNYFYRVSLLKQMIDRGEDIKRQDWASTRSSSGEGPDEETVAEEVTQSDDTVPSYSQVQQQDISYQAQQSFNQTSVDTSSANLIINQELESSESGRLVAEADDLKSKLKELNIGSLDDGQDDNKKWEEELQKDLQEFELVSGDLSALDEEALDKDIMELGISSKNSK